MSREGAPEWGQGKGECGPTVPGLCTNVSTRNAPHSPPPKGPHSLGSSSAHSSAPWTGLWEDIARLVLEDLGSPYGQSVCMAGEGGVGRKER